MFIGHFALAFGAKKAAPAASLALLFIACELADLVWPVLVLTGIERFAIQPGVTAVTPLDFISYPWSHSLLMLCVYAVALAGVFAAATGAPAQAAIVLAALVVSHWVLDVITHRPDMPLAPHVGTKLGLGLWNSVPGTIAVETAMFVAGLALYLRAAPPRTRGRAIGLWSLVALMLIIYFGNLFGPPPPSVTAVAWSACGIWLFVVWAYAVDR